MGLPFKDIVTGQELGWEAMSGRTLAVDAYNAIYQFLATIRGPDGNPLSDAAGAPTSHLMGVLYRTTSLLAQGVRPIWVFDGKPSELKAGTLRARFAAKQKAETEWKEALAAGDLETARRKAAATSRLTRPMAEEARELLGALGVQTVQAPSEGEAQAAAMAAWGQVWGAASEDYDSLLFGAPRLVRGLAARARKGSAPGAQLILRDELLKTLGVSSEELIMIGVIVGTDFNEGATGYGPKKALKIAREHLGWDATLRKVGIEPASVEPVAELFRHPVVDATPPMAPTPMDEEAVRSIVVERHGFSEDRVRAALQRARRRPPPAPVATETRGHQRSLEAYGTGEGAP